MTNPSGRARPDAAADRAATHTVKLELPCDPQYVRVARLAAAGVAVPAGFSVDDVEDLTIAVDELSSTLVEAGRPDGEVVLVLTVADGSIAVEGHTTLSGPYRVNRDRPRLSREILTAVAHEHEVHDRAGVLRFRLLCRRRGPRAELN